MKKVAFLISICSGLIGMSCSGIEIEVLHDFAGTSDGANPVASLVRGSDGAWYGTTAGGGNSGNGTFFKLVDEQFIHLGNFSIASNPYSELLAVGTDFYGTTLNGGANDQGTVYKVNEKSGLVTIIHDFSLEEGKNPSALTKASDGNFYGTATFGGKHGTGTIFKLTPTGNFSKIYDFPPVSTQKKTNGTNPVSIVAVDDFLYGVTEYGGKKTLPSFDGCGTVFQSTSDGVVNNIHIFAEQFSDQGCVPTKLISGEFGQLDGVTATCKHTPGLSCEGVVFTIDKEGTTYKILQSFIQNQGGGAVSAFGLKEVAGGGFFVALRNQGARYGCGGLYASFFSSLKFIVFNGTNGCHPESAPVEEHGVYYGVTYQGGLHDMGVIYKLTQFPIQGQRERKEVENVNEY